MRNTVVGVFENWNEARTAIERLREAGFPSENVSVVASHQEAGAHPHLLGDQEGEGVVVGAAAGGALGAAGGWALGLAVLAVPGVGPILAAGPILGAITGLAAGAGVGSLLGALAGSTVPHEEVAEYEEAFTQGSVLVGVNGLGREEVARNILQRCGAVATRREDLAAEEHVGEAAEPVTEQLREGIPTTALTADSESPDVLSDTPGVHAEGGPGGGTTAGTPEAAIQSGSERDFSASTGTGDRPTVEVAAGSGSESVFESAPPALADSDEAQARPGSPDYRGFTTDRSTSGSEGGDRGTAET
jgi:heat induced stress protein YflT